MNERKPANQYITIERLYTIHNADGSCEIRRETVVKNIPLRTHVVDTIVGELGISVCPPNMRRRDQKIIFTGKLVEKNSSSLRRPVRIPFSNKSIRHDICQEESLIFSVSDNCSMNII